MVEAVSAMLTTSSGSNEEERFSNLTEEADLHSQITSKT